MAFLFKTKKSQDRALASRDGNSTSQGPQPAGARLARDEKTAIPQRSTPTGSLNSLDMDATVGSPDHGQARRGGSLDQLQSNDPPRTILQSTNPNASLYPWSQRRLAYTSLQSSPFPRYGAAVNATASKEGDIYLMGGLINSSTVKGDIWMIEAGGAMTCYPLVTTAEGPGPRVGHASLLVGNAFIVYGGDTKIEESDVLDETLYLLNTSTRHWSRALPAGPRPSGRYGHSLNILGSKIYIFGGQVEGYFMNDLSAFDLNHLQMSNNRWEILLQGEVSPTVPAARTNHSMVTYGDKMYLFGGTNGFQWFNDVWCYDPAANQWSLLDSIGYIPTPREGHAAALVDDVMYIFGGRTEEGTDLGDLAAFRISSRRWYTFQNMGPSPSPRSGHSMTTVGKSIIVLGGEPSSTATTTNDLGILYVLDTTKIRYPNDSQQSAQRLPQQNRRPSASESQTSPRQMASREGPTPSADTRKPPVAPVLNNSGMNGYKSSPVIGTDAAVAPPNANSGLSGAAVTPASRLPRAAGISNAPGPPSQGPNNPIKPPPETVSTGRARGPSVDRAAPTGLANAGPTPTAANRDVNTESDPPSVNGHRTPTQSTVAAPAAKAKPDSGGGTDSAKTKQARHEKSQGSVDSSTDSGSRATRASSPPLSSTRQTSNSLSRRSSGRNSQTVALLKELDSARNRNAWYASELELARKAGYVSTASWNPSLENKAAETFDDEDRPLIEALLAMRTELANVQTAVDKQALAASKQIAEAEKQRDAAIQEAVYAKAKMAALVGGSSGGTAQADEERDGLDRSTEVGKKLASALHLQKDLRSRLDTMKNELDVERKARLLADDTAAASQKRTTDLESYKQETSAEVERLKAELHLVQREARESATTGAEAVSALELIKIEKEKLEAKYQEAVGNWKAHDETLESFRTAMVASQDARTHLEKKLEEERVQREKLETKFTKLKAEHDGCTAQLSTSAQRIKDAEELAEKHAKEAQTHRQAVISGLDRISTRDVSTASTTDTERSVALQHQVDASSALAKKYQQEADAASDKLRSTEERLAGLEQSLEQANREGVALRKQLQTALKEVQSLQAALSEAKNQLSTQELEMSAMTVQHNALKDILREREEMQASALKAREAASLETTAGDDERIRELESQLALANTSHEESKQAFAAQAQESELAYREKLSQLESDYQSAVHYVKGTEKMLKQLKEQLSRYKAENGRLKADVEELESRLASGGTRTVSTEWESERTDFLKRIGALEAELRDSGARLEKNLQMLQSELAESKRQRDEAMKSSEEASKSLDLQRKDLEQLQSQNSVLEQRASEAEQKISLLLDQVEQVESPVGAYGLRSRQLAGPNSAASPGPDEASDGRPAGSETESTFGGSALDARNSAVLDNLATELETLRSHWEATNKNYRLSGSFDLDQSTTDKDEAEEDEDEAETAAGLGLSESLTHWRKKLDREEGPADAKKKKKQQQQQQEGR